MKVTAFNGSAHTEGNTYQAIRMVFDELEKEGIETEIVQVGNCDVKGCIACGHCAKARDEKCGLAGDQVNEWIQKMKESDGIIIGSPVHYSAISANMKSFLDRAFYVGGANGGLYRHKVGASVVAVRRSGGLPAFNQLNNYFSYAEMMLPASNYWNVIHGTRPGDAVHDEEGVQIMRILGKNMAWLMKLIDHGKETVPAPAQERKQWMSFIR